MSKKASVKIYNKEGGIIDVIEAETFTKAIQEFIDKSNDGLMGVDLTDKDMTEVKLKGVNCSFTGLSNANFSNMDLTNVSFKNAILDNNPDFTNSILTNTDFTGARCHWPRKRKKNS